MLKDLSWQSLTDFSRQFKVAFLHDPMREIEVYRELLVRGMAQIIPYLGQGGGNQAYVQDVPKGVFLNMIAYNQDNVTIGNVAPSAGGVVGTNGSMAKILGDVSVTSGVQVAVVLDDSGNTAARNVKLQPKLDDYGDRVIGMAPGSVLFRMGNTSSVTLVGGKKNDLFSMAGLVFTSAMRIDGGEGENTLDFSGVPDPSSAWFSIPEGTAAGLAGGIKRIQNVTGVP